MRKSKWRKVFDIAFKYPDLKQVEIAKKTGFSQPFISTILSSAEVKKARAFKRNKNIDPEAEQIESWELEYNHRKNKRKESTKKALNDFLEVWWK